MMGSEFYTKNRQRFSSLLKPMSIAVLHPHDSYPYSADQFFPYKANPNLLYLSGIGQPETILLIFPDSPNPAYKEILFISDRDESAEIRHGKRLSLQEAESLSGVKNVYPLSTFKATINDVMSFAENVYLDYNEPGAYTELNLRFVKEFMSAYPLHNYKRAYPLISKLRLIKQEPEIALIKKAISITQEALERAATFIKPGLFEYELEAEISYVFTKNNARRHGFQPIIASGINACYLHYNTNNSVCKNNELILFDIGAEYQNYTSDISRTFPVNGTFNSRQKQVYTAVLNILKKIQPHFVKGNTINNINIQATPLIEAALIELSLVTEGDIKKQDKSKPVYKKYLPHGISHFLGMDAHDCGHKYIEFEPGMVLTCEPAIYIFEEGIGIRLENDILITESTPVILSEDIPIEIHDIEKICINK